jgi:hypothetical protein
MILYSRTFTFIDSHTRNYDFIWFLQVWNGKEHSLSVFENRVLSRILGRRRSKGTMEGNLRSGYFSYCRESKCTDLYLYSPHTSRRGAQLSSAISSQKGDKTTKDSKTDGSKWYWQTQANIHTRQPYLCVQSAQRRLTLASRYTSSSSSSRTQQLASACNRIRRVTEQDAAVASFQTPVQMAPPSAPTSRPTQRLW